jgi:monoamine oxidase
MVSKLVDADVCVIGAGFAGLTAARRLAQQGLSVVVLEARDRVGGRTWTESRPSGASVDRGGAWLGPHHSAAFALAAELGVETYKTYVAGSHLLIGGGKTQKYKGLIPKISPLAVLQIGAAQFRIDRMARTVPIEEPWRAPRAAEWDRETVAAWLDRTRIRSKVGSEVFEMAVRGLFAAEDMNDVSLLHLLYLVHAHEKIETLFSIENGAQENLVVGGLGGLAGRVADDLDGAIHLGRPVRRITHHGDRVTVEADGLTASAPFAVVTVPPVLAAEIDFDPPLSDDRRELQRRSKAGHETKTMVVYDEPFWRAAGLSGQTAASGSAAEVTIDASPADLTYGVIASFTFGSVAGRVGGLPEPDRRQAVLDALVARFGPKAASPVDFVETSWWQQEWSRGCSMAHLAPGMLTRLGPLLRQPVGRIHWAGTETSTVSHGAVEGAIRSGARAAAEILERVAGAKSPLGPDRAARTPDTPQPTG